MSEQNKSSQSKKNSLDKNIKYKTVKITEDTDGKAIKIAQGGFGKVYKVVKYINNCEQKNIVPFAQKHTRVFEIDGNLIGHNLKEISAGYKYLNHENLQKFEYITIDEKDYINSKYIINMSLADMSFNDLIYSNLSKDNRILFFFPILKQLIKGLSYIHSNFISHGDIKPENILLNGDKILLNNCNFDGHTPLTVPSDFSQILNDKNCKEYLKSATFQITDYSGLNIEYNNTMDNTSTMYYKSPELFVRYDKKFEKSIKEKYGPYNDIWSISITMLEYLTKSNIISKLYKKSMKIKEKEFLTRFFHCMKSLDVTIVLKNSGYDINNYYVKNIINVLELMLTKKIQERINIYNLSIFIDHYITKDKKYYINNNIYNNKLYENIHLYNNIIEHKDDIKVEYINIKLRKNAIDKLNEFLKIDKYSYPNDKQYLPLSLLLFDRLLSKNILKDNSSSSEYMYNKTLLECYYIASRYLLSDIDIIFIIEYLNIDIDIIHMDILEILKQLDYDIYRPTILTFLNNQDDDIFHSEYIINLAISYYCDSKSIKTDYDLSEKYINEVINNEIENLIKDDDDEIENLKDDEKENNKKNDEHNILDKIYINEPSFFSVIRTPCSDVNISYENVGEPLNIDLNQCTKPKLKREDYSFLYN